MRRRDGGLACGPQSLGAGRTRAAEDRGAAMNLATVAEYALMLTRRRLTARPAARLANLSRRPPGCSRTFSAAATTAGTCAGS